MGLGSGDAPGYAGVLILLAAAALLYPGYRVVAELRRPPAAAGPRLNGAHYVAAAVAATIFLGGMQFLSAAGDAYIMWLGTGFYGGLTSSALAAVLLCAPHARSFVRVTASATPDRVRWAMEALRVRPGEHLLEIGCGPGAAIEAVGQRLGSGGSIIGIDRSTTAIERARVRNAKMVAAGWAVVVAAPFTPAGLSAAGLPTDGHPYDAIFAINVNLFWTGPAAGEMALVRALLRGNGRLLLCYHPPAGRGPEIADRTARTLAANGFTPTVLDDPTSGFVVVEGRRRGVVSPSAART